MNVSLKRPLSKETFALRDFCPRHQFEKKIMADHISFFIFILYNQFSIIRDNEIKKLLTGKIFLGPMSP